MIIKFARLEFDAPRPVEEMPEAFEAVAVGLDALGEELEHSVVSRQYVESIIRSMSNMLVVTDARLMITRTNPALTACLATSDRALVGKNLADMLDPAIAQNLRIAVSERNAEPFSGDTYLVVSEGNHLPIRLNTSLLEGDAGDPPGLVCVAQDIRARIKTENELHAHRENLAELVRERTQKLEEAQHQLVRKERLAALGQLIATVAHELRNPLGTIKSSLFVLEHTAEEDPQTERALGRCNRSILRCDRIIEELLDFTRVKTTQRDVIVLDTWLEALITEQQPPEGVNLATSFGLADRALKIDPERLRRAFINVFDNACDSMTGSAAASPQSTLQVTTRERDGAIEIEVRDNGTGMSEEVQAKLFEPLYSTKSFGVGLGMAVVQQVLEEHGGGVRVSSAVGRGTTMTLWIPADTA